MERSQKDDNISDGRCRELPVAAMSVAAIKLELSRRGLSVFGLKPDLVRRLELSRQRQDKISVPSKLPNLFGLTSTNRKRHLDSSTIGHVAKRLKTKAHGHLRGQAVWVGEQEDMLYLYTHSHGFGKGSLSRTFPSYALGSDPNYIRGRAARQLQALEQMNDIDEETAEARISMEHLQLTLCEAFYATYVLDLLKISTEEGQMENEQHCWNLFCEKSQWRFPYEYAAYYRYRTTGWLPRSGLKYGVDWVLYKAGTNHHTHASYCIVLNYRQRGDKPGLERSWIGLQNRLRLVKNVAKTLVVVSVDFEAKKRLGWQVYPQNARQAIESVKITEVTLDRWTFSG